MKAVTRVYTLFLKTTKVLNKKRFDWPFIILYKEFWPFGLVPSNLWILIIIEKLFLFKWHVVRCSVKEIKHFAVHLSPSYICHTCRYTSVTYLSPATWQKECAFYDYYNISNHCNMSSLQTEYNTTNVHSL